MKHTLLVLADGMEHVMLGSAVDPVKPIAAPRRDRPISPASLISIGRSDNQVIAATRVNTADGHREPEVVENTTSRFTDCSERYAVSVSRDWQRYRLG